MADHQNDLPMTRFAIRLSPRVPEERLLSQLMARDLADRSVNLSAVVKSLLLAWYQQRLTNSDPTTPFLSAINLMPPGPQPTLSQLEERENPDDDLVLRMTQISFDKV